MSPSAVMLNTVVQPVPHLPHNLWPGRTCFIPCLEIILGAAGWWCLAGVHQHLCRYMGAVGVLHSRSPWAAEFPLRLLSKPCNVEPPVWSLSANSAHFCRMGTLGKLSSEVLFSFLNVGFGVNCSSTALYACQKNR